MLYYYNTTSKGQGQTKTLSVCDRLRARQNPQNTIYELRVFRQIFRGQGFDKCTAANTNNPIAIYTGVGGPRGLMRLG